MERAATRKDRGLSHDRCRSADDGRLLPSRCVIANATARRRPRRRLQRRRLREDARRASSRRWPWSISWAQLIAASGLVAIAYTNREPAADLEALLQHVRDNAAALGIDGDRIGVWACLGQRAAGAVRADGAGRDFPEVRRAALRLTCSISTAPSASPQAATRPSASPIRNAGTSFDDLREDLPLLIARAGQEQFPGLNDSIDRFFAKALALQPAGHAVNHAAGPHAFDLLDDSATLARGSSGRCWIS